MRFVLLFLLLLSCNPASNPIKPRITGRHYSLGKKAGISWECHEGHSENFVWAKCRFRNVSTYTSKVCINVAHYHVDGFSGYVVNPYRLCTPNMQPAAMWEGYSSILKDTLDPLCSYDLEGCSLLTFADNANPNN